MLVTWPQATYPNGRPNVRSLGLGDLGDLASGVDVPVPESLVLVPSDMIAITHEWFQYHIGFGWPGIVFAKNISLWKPKYHRLDSALFCDGHVETSNPDLIPQKLGTDGSWYFQPSAAYAKRWNRDNRPHPETWP